MNAKVFMPALLLLSATPVASLTLWDPDAERTIAELQAGHVESNLPDEAEFSRLLERDLNAYFAGRGVRNPVSRFELLRRGATQSGIAYPKFYLWVQVSSGKKRVADGAARVAAVQRERFEITDFLPSQEIRADPESVGVVFPASLVAVIRERARLSARSRAK